MRVMSDVREAAWGAVQASESSSTFDFGDYGGEHFERLLGAAAPPGFEEPACRDRVSCPTARAS